MKYLRHAILLAGLVVAGLYRRVGGARSAGSALHEPQPGGWLLQPSAATGTKDGAGRRHDRPSWAWDDVTPVVNAADRALDKLIGEGKDRVVFRTGGVRVLRPEHDDYRLRRVEAG